MSAFGPERTSLVAPRAFEGKERKCVFACRASAVVSHLALSETCLIQLHCRSMVSIERLIKQRKKASRVQWFTQIANSAISNHTGTCRIIRASRNKDDRRLMASGGQVPLKLNAAHFRHMYICNQTRRRLNRI